jgi:hypothetical protein
MIFQSEIGLLPAKLNQSHSNLVKFYAIEAGSSSKYVFLPVIFIFLQQ